MDKKKKKAMDSGTAGKWRPHITNSVKSKGKNAPTWKANTLKGVSKKK